MDGLDDDDTELKIFKIDFDKFWNFLQSVFSEYLILSLLWCWWSKKKCLPWYLALKYSGYQKYL